MELQEKKTCHLCFGDEEARLQLYAGDNAANAAKWVHTTCLERHRRKTSRDWAAASERFQEDITRNSKLDAERKLQAVTNQEAAQLAAALTIETDKEQMPLEVEEKVKKRRSLRESGMLAAESVPLRQMCAMHTDKLGKRNIEEPINLVLILGGVSHTQAEDYRLNRLYKQLAIEKRADVEVVVVDPDTWDGGDDTGVSHWQVTLQDCATKFPPTEMLASYNKIAIIDDIQFKPFFGSLRPTQLRDRIEDSAEWKQLRDMADNHPDRVTWWLFSQRINYDLVEINHVKIPIEWQQAGKPSKVRIELAKVKFVLCERQFQENNRTIKYPFSTSNVLDSLMW